MSSPCCSTKSLSHSSIYQHWDDSDENELVHVIALCLKYFCLFIVPIAIFSNGYAMVYVLKYCLEIEEKNSLIGHIFFCTLGLNFVSVQAILTINMAPVIGHSTAKKRSCAHAFLILAGQISNIVGIYHIADYGKIGGINLRSTHSIIGIVTSILSLVAVVSGSYALVFHWPINIFHILFGLPAFCLSSACLFHIIYQSSLKPHLGQSYRTACIVCLLVYTSIIAILVLMKILLRLLKV